MSEYQYYEFQAVERPLTPQEQNAVARLSSRVDLHPTRAVFVYNYSNFPGRATDILATYYDALFYIANRGSTQLAFRFPQALIDVDRIRPYCVDIYLTCDVVGEHVIINFEWQEDGGFDDWIEGEGMLAGLLPLREAILRQVSAFFAGEAAGRSDNSRHRAANGRRAAADGEGGAAERSGAAKGGSSSQPEAENEGVGP